MKSHVPCGILAVYGNNDFSMQGADGWKKCRTSVTDVTMVEGEHFLLNENIIIAVVLI